MLETLKQINKNLERIANSLESKNKTGVTSSNQVATVPANPIPTAIAQPVKAPTTTEPTTVIPVAQSTQPAPVPVAQPAPAQNTIPIPTTVPVAPTQQGFTQDQIAVAMANAVAAGGMPIIQKTLASLGVQALTEVKPEDYNKLASMLQAQGVEV